ncbi:MAG: hypothetical protein PHS93_05555 [Candidatus Omnitrophica bacterium]|nr:hypothetical protein [Candidatus Omnitrophota bacterium]MDD5352616.1 hypothetical protein [Candidatus Omnitrophota bacterium]MDD5550214.1 hypothetical protein [Candidatus Omnitrophota bacterium]
MLNKRVGRNYIRITLHPEESKFLFINTIKLIERYRVTDLNIAPAYLGVKWNSKQIDYYYENLKSIGLYYINILDKENHPYLYIDNFSIFEDSIFKKSTPSTNNFDCENKDVLCIMPDGLIYTCDSFFYNSKLREQLSLGNVLDLQISDFEEKLKKNLKYPLHSLCLNSHFDSIYDRRNILRLMGINKEINLFLFNLTRERNLAIKFKKKLISRNNKNGQ